MSIKTQTCVACGRKHGAMPPFCQGCRSKWHHTHKRIKKEGLIVDEAGGAWWVWDKKGEVLVMAKPTKFDAIKALAFGDDDDEDEPATKSAAQLEREIAYELGR